MHRDKISKKTKKKNPNNKKTVTGIEHPTIDFSWFYGQGTELLSYDQVHFQETAIGV